MELSVENVALIESARLSFQPGFTVFTGETGAGKTILLDAIGLLLGNRASVDLIRVGQQRAVVEALFAFDPLLASEKLKPLCESFGIGLDEAEGTLLVSREINASGRSVCRVNGRMATVQALHDIGLQLVQQHGQHEQQSLLQPDEQIRLLDLFGRHGELLKETENSHASWLQAQHELSEARQNEQERVRLLDLLTFQIEEIQSAKLESGEEEEWLAKRRRLQHAEQIAEALEQAIAALDGTTEQAGVTALLSDALTEVQTAASHDDALAEVAGLVETAQVHAQEALRELYRRMDSIEADPEALEQAENRLAQIRSLERKYGTTIEEVQTFLQTCVTRRDELNDEDHLNLLETVLADCKARLLDTASRLSAARRSAAQTLSGEIQTALRTLALPHAEFRIEVSERANPDGSLRVGPRGCDEVVFLFSANRGEPLRPLSRIASGGELSRTLLAIKAVLAEVDAVDTLIFDEIDVGTSGVAAQGVAERLQQIGRARQVLCVTHSAQVAAAAGAHYCIEKTEDNAVTKTSVIQLDHAGRVLEIARLVGGSIAGDTAHAHASALIAGFQPRQ